MASDSEVDDDYSSVQEQLLQKLDSFLDDQIGDQGRKVKLKKNKNVSKKKEKLKGNGDNVKGTSSGEGNASRAIVGRIRDLTSAATREKQRSTAKKLSDQKNFIKDKVEKLLDSNPKQTAESVDSASNNEESDLGQEGFEYESNSDQSEDNFGSDEGFSDDEEGGREQISGMVLSAKEKQLERFKAALGITDSDLLQAKREQERQEDEKNKQVQTIGLLKSKKRRAPPEIVVFQGPGQSQKKKSKKDSESAEKQESSTSPTNLFDLHKARFDVRKFGIDGMNKKDKKKGMTDLLLRLGAKAPKSQPLNYKDLQRKRANDRQREAEKRDLDRKMGWKVNPKGRKRSKRDRNDVGQMDGQIGSYRDGVQVVSKKARDLVTSRRGHR